MTHDQNAPRPGSAADAEPAGLRVDLDDRFDLEKAGLAATAEPLRRHLVDAALARGCAVGVALARSRLGINLALQSRWREAADELACCHDGMRAQAHEHPGAWALHLTMLGQIAIEDDRLAEAHAHFLAALPGYVRAADSVDAEDPLHAGTMALLVGGVETPAELQTLADQVLPFAARLDLQRLGFGFGFTAGLAGALQAFDPPSPALTTQLLGAVGTLLDAYASAPAAPRVDWSDFDPLFALPWPDAAGAGLRAALLRAATRPGLAGDDRLALARVQVLAALAAGEREAAAAVLAGCLVQPLPAEQAAAWLPVVEKLVRALHRAGPREDVPRFAEAAELWLLRALPGDDELLLLEQHARLATLNGRTAEAAALRRQQLTRCAERHGAQSTEVLAALAALRGALDAAGNVPFELLAVCRQGIDLAVRQRGEHSGEAWWWRAMQVLALIDAGEIDGALKAAWKAAQALPAADAQASGCIWRLLQNMSQALQRQGLVAEAQQLAAVAGRA